MVPIPVGYAALAAPNAAGGVRNARDATVSLRFVESVYSLGEWISPHRLQSLDQLLWHAETDEVQGLYRCRNGYRPIPQPGDGVQTADTTDDWDDASAYAYT